MSEPTTINNDPERQSRIAKERNARMIRVLEIKNGFLVTTGIDGEVTAFVGDECLDECLDEMLDFIGTYYQNKPWKSKKKS